VSASRLVSELTVSELVCQRDSEMSVKHLQPLNVLDDLLRRGVKVYYG